MVEIARSLNMLRITPDCLDVLEHALSFQKAKRGVGGIRHYEKTNLFRVVDGQMFVPAGLLQRVQTRLTSMQIPHTYVDLNPSKLPEPDYSKLRLLRGEQNDWIVKISVNDRGIIDAPTGAGKSFTIEQVCRMWATANIVVVAPTAGLAEDHYNALRSIFAHGEVGLMGAGRHDFGCRITCCVDKSMERLPLEKSDIVLFDEVHRAAAPGNAQQLTRASKARIYGFSASWKGRGDNADMETEALVGPVICTLDYETAKNQGMVVPVKVLLWPCNEVTAPEDNVSDIRFDKVMVWKNASKNQDIAKAINWVRQSYGEDIQILVLVQTIIHAFHLCKYLPDFEVIYAAAQIKDKMWKRFFDKGLADPSKHPLDKKDLVEAKESFKVGRLRRVIATSTWGTGVDFPDLNLVVRADTQPSSIISTQYPGRVTRLADDKEFGLVLDFDDNYNDRLNGRFKKRMTVYRKKKWEIEWIYPPRKRLKEVIFK